MRTERQVYHTKAVTKAKSSFFKACKPNHLLCLDVYPENMIVFDPTIPSNLGRTPSQPISLSVAAPHPNPFFSHWPHPITTPLSPKLYIDKMF